MVKKNRIDQAIQQLEKEGYACDNKNDYKTICSIKMDNRIDILERKNKLIIKNMYKNKYLEIKTKKLDGIEYQVPTFASNDDSGLHTIYKSRKESTIDVEITRHDNIKNNEIVDEYMNIIFRPHENIDKKSRLADVLYPTDKDF